MLAALGENTVIFLNQIPKHCGQWIPLLSQLTSGINSNDLIPILEHGTKDNLRKSLNRRNNNNNENNPDVYENVETNKLNGNNQNSNNRKGAEDFLISHTKLMESTQRLITKETIPELYADYVASVKSDLISPNIFTEVYKSLRILRDKHCKHDVFSCPYCDELSS